MLPATTRYHDGTLSRWEMDKQKELKPSLIHGKKATALSRFTTDEKTRAQKRNVCDCAAGQTTSHLKAIWIATDVDI